MILIGQRIKELRNKHRYTQIELAEKVGVTKSTIAAYENDTRLPSFEVLIRMSKIFKVSVDSILLGYTEEMLDVHGLNVEQLEILQNIIFYFRKSNILEDVDSNVIPELKKYMEE